MLEFAALLRPTTDVNRRLLQCIVERSDKKKDRRRILATALSRHMNPEMNNLFPSKPRRCFNIFTSVFLTMALSIFAAEPSSEDDDENADPSAPRFISPDGRYGLLVTEETKGGLHEDRVELIEVPTRRSMVVLSDPERPERPDKARLDWSKDSQRVAAYTGTRVDGFTRIFVREGDNFVEVELPKLPNLPDPESDAAFRRKNKIKFLKWIDAGSVEFVRWLQSGVELKYSGEVATQDGGQFSMEIDATIEIDAKHRATLKKVVKKEGFE
jgi:hypothetical protein